MAQVARIAPTGAGAGAAAAGSRQRVGLRNVATVEAAPVEELSPMVGVSYDEAGLLFQDYGREPESKDRRRGEAPNPIVRVLGASSQAFAAVFEVNQSAGAGRAPSGGSSAAFFAERRAIAINMYEFNARISLGTDAKPGESLNMHL